MVRRYAFTLIELLFAIIIIAVSVMSLPMMNQAVGKGIDSNIAQEAIFAAATELSEAVGAHWDENSLEPGEPNSFAKVIDIAGACDANSSSLTFRQMQGHINQKLHRKCLDSNITMPSNINVAGVTSLSDMDHNLVNIFSYSTANEKGYKDEYKSQLVVTRPADFNGSNTNIKKIESTITSSDDETIAVLVTYSANIGEVDYLKRMY